LIDRSQGREGEWNDALVSRLQARGYVKLVGTRPIANPAGLKRGRALAGYELALRLEESYRSVGGCPLRLIGGRAEILS
jgi:hypothetical protein